MTRTTDPAMKTAKILVTTALADRLIAARFVRRATARAGIGRFGAIVTAARVLVTGCSTVTMRRPDAVMYLALARGLAADDALYVQRQQARAAEITIGDAVFGYRLWFCTVVAGAGEGPRELDATDAPGAIASRHTVAILNRAYELGMRRSKPS